MSVVLAAVALDVDVVVAAIWETICDVAWLAICDVKTLAVCEFEELTVCTIVETGHIEPNRLTTTVCTASWLSPPGYCAITPRALIVSSACPSAL